MGLIRNITRVLRDIAPVVAFAAPIVAPGLGGAVLSQVALSFARSAPRRSSNRAIARGAPVVPRFCPRMGVAGAPFSSQFQARNFSTGGAFAGRPFVFQGGRVPIGRDVIAQFCPAAAPALPVVRPTVAAPVGVQAALDTVAAIPPVPAVVVPPVVAPIVTTDFLSLSDRLARRFG